MYCHGVFGASTSKNKGNAVFFREGYRYSDTNSALSEFAVASWVVNCPHCRKTFEHSQIEKSFINFHFPEKPKFPQEGQALVCKNCAKESVYQQADLRYQR
jgi:hypothetical protein